MTAFTINDFLERAKESLRKYYALFVEAKNKKSSNTNTARRWTICCLTGKVFFVFLLNANDYHFLMKIYLKV